MKGPDNKKNVTDVHTSAIPTRSSLPRDAYGIVHGGTWAPGQVPRGGYRSVYTFDGGDHKNSPTTKPEPQNRIIKDGK